MITIIIVLIIVTMTISMFTIRVVEAIAVDESDLVVDTNVNVGTLQSVNNFKTKLKSVEFENLDVLADGIFKSYMYGSSVKDKTSKQYALVSKAVENAWGQLTIDGVPLVACSSYYGSVGDIIYVTIDGIRHKFMIGDIKKDHELINHTHPDGSIIEFIVGPNIRKDVKSWGSWDLVYPGPIEKIERGV